MAHESSAKQPGYLHAPLDPSSDQIRLFKLKRSNPQSSVIECDIETFHLATTPPYIALSYRWGDAAKTHTISLNGRRFEIRDNLHQFLAALRNDAANTSLLWTDAICIDQTTTAERNHQVQLMSRIYQGSRLVVAWLDRDRKCISAAAHFAKAKGHRKDTSRLRKQSAKPHTPSFLSDFTARRALTTLLSSPYFTRLWVIQELLLAPSLRLLAGPHWIVEAEIISEIDSLPWSAPLRIPKYIFTERRYRTSLASAALAPPPPRSLDHCITRYSGASCADPRDKVYGLLGLVDDVHLAVDYSRSAREVFLDAVGAVYLDERNRYGSLVWDEQCAALARGMGMAEREVKGFMGVVERLRGVGARGGAVELGFDEARRWWWMRYGFDEGVERREEFACP